MYIYININIYEQPSINIWRGSYDLVRWSYKCISEARSAFQCEMIAISDAISDVHSILCMKHKVAHVGN